MLETGLILLVLLFIALAARWLRGAGPLGYWVAAWVAAGAASLLPVASPVSIDFDLIAQPLGTTAAALVFAGACVFARRQVPRWLLPGALAFGALRGIVALRFGESAGYALGLLVEPILVLAAGRVAIRVTKAGETSVAERLLGPALIAIALAGAIHLAWVARGRAILEMVPLWLAVGPPVLGIQIQAAANRLRRSLRTELEDRVARRTSELAASEARYRTITELASDFVFKVRIDRNGSLTREWIAGAFEATLGMRPEDLDGAGWLQLLEPAARDRTLEQYRSIRLHRPIELDLLLQGLDGHERWIHLRLATLRADAEGNVEVLGSARDVTALKTAQQESERMARHVEQVQRNESLGILAGGIAHDFNNLLTVIRGSAQLALDELADGAPAKARVARIAEAAQHAASLTDQMLAYAGKSSIERSPLDLGVLVASMAELLRASVPARCVLQFDGPRRSPAARYAGNESGASEGDRRFSGGGESGGAVIEGDANGMRQVVLNLVLNAAEAQGDAGGRVVVSTGVVAISRAEVVDALGSTELAAGDVVELAVRDDGCGMDAATTARLFEPFFTTKFSGRGLGMAAVLGIVRAHGGAIRVESEVGRGTCIRVLLPMSARRPAAIKEKKAGGTSARGGTVLVVDDDDGIRELASEILGAAGFRVLTASGGREALELVRAEGAARIDVVLLDLAMPDISGEEAFLRLRELRADLPVILVTGYDAGRIAESFAARSLDGLLRKPWEPEDLVGAVVGVLGKRKKGDVAAESGPESG